MSGLVQSGGGLITSWSWTGRRTWRESGSSDVLSPSAAFYGRASSWQCSSVSGSRSETFLAPHPRTAGGRKHTHTHINWSDIFSIKKSYYLVIEGGGGFQLQPFPVLPIHALYHFELGA